MTSSEVCYFYTLYFYEIWNKFSLQLGLQQTPIFPMDDKWNITRSDLNLIKDRNQLLARFLKQRLVVITLRCLHLRNGNERTKSLNLFDRPFCIHKESEGNF